MSTHIEIRSPLTAEEVGARVVEALEHYYTHGSHWGSWSVGFTEDGEIDTSEVVVPIVSHEGYYWDYGPWEGDPADFSSWSKEENRAPLIEEFGDHRARLVLHATDEDRDITWCVRLRENAIE